MRLPALQPPFPPAFLALLQQLLAFGGRRLGARAEQARARRVRLSQSGVFAGHRAYVAGDDPRRIDWNAYARSGHLFVKLLEEEERRTTSILLDTSVSMLAGTPCRLTGALRLCAILGGLSLQHLDGLCVLAGGEVIRGGGADMLPRLLERLAGLRPGAYEPLAAARELRRLGAPGKVIWISDFAEPGAFAPALALLRRGGNRVTGWQPVVDDDGRAPARGFLRIGDPETGAEVSIAVDDELAAAFAAELAALGRAQEQVFAQGGHALQRFLLPAEGDFDLRHWTEAAWSFRR